MRKNILLSVLWLAVCSNIQTCAIECKSQGSKKSSGLDINARIECIYNIEHKIVH